MFCLGFYAYYFFFICLHIEVLVISKKTKTIIPEAENKVFKKINK